MKYICVFCNYNTNIKCNYIKHLQTIKHIKNTNKSIKNNKHVCKCGKIYKYHSGLWKHKKKCNINNEIFNIKNEIIELKKNNKILTKELIKSNKNNNELIKEVKKIKNNKNQIISQNITNNQINNNQNISINVFLNEYCKDAMNFSDFIKKLEISFDDLTYTGDTSYVEGISKILIKNLCKLNKLKRPIHCSDVKRKVLYIKNKEGWEKDKQHENITKCIKDVELKQIKKLPNWVKENKIDIFKDDVNGLKYQKLVFNSMGGMTSDKREKNKKNVIKKISENVDFKI